MVASGSACRVDRPMNTHPTNPHDFRNLVGGKPFIAEGKDAVFVDGSLPPLVDALGLGLLDTLPLALLDDRPFELSDSTEDAEVEL